ncbi:hypothetical protein NQ314_016521, partial [Rhamnusium bicolor]
MGKRRYGERQRSRSKERKRSPSKERKRSRHDSGSLSFRSRSRSHHAKRHRVRDRHRHSNVHRNHSPDNNRHDRVPSRATSSTGTYWQYPHSHSYASSEERSSSDTRSTQSSQKESIPSPRSGRPLPHRGGRPPSPVDIINNDGASPRQDAGETPPVEAGDTIVINNDIVLPEDTLQALGEQQQGAEQALELHPIISNRWKSILAKGLDKTEKAVLLDKHSLPGNLTTLKAPIVNDEVLRAIPPNTQNKDKFQQNNQNQLGKGISAIGAAINILLTNNEIDKENKNAVIALLSESGKILTDVHYNISLTRRALITPTVNKTIGDISKTVPVEELLFGADLTERIKRAKDVEKSIGDIRQKSESSSHMVKKARPVGVQEGTKTTEGPTPPTIRAESQLSEVPDKVQVKNELDCKKAKYGTFNQHRSALSLILPVDIGKNLLVRRFLRAVARLRPPRPKYNLTWDPSIVLNNIRRLGRNDDLPLFRLSRKLSILLALATGQRIQTLSLIKVENISFTEEGSRIYIPDRIKTTGVKSFQPCLELPIFQENEI